MQNNFVSFIYYHQSERNNFKESDYSVKLLNLAFFVGDSLFLLAACCSCVVFIAQVISRLPIAQNIFVSLVEIQELLKICASFISSFARGLIVIIIFSSL